MSLAISPLSLLPALFNSLHSRLNNLINAMSVFNPAPFSHKLSRENTAIAVQNLPGSPKFYLSATATRRFWGNMNTIGGVCGLLITCTQPHAGQDSGYPKITQQLQN